jgi:hypothetical protein
MYVSLTIVHRSSNMLSWVFNGISVGFTVEVGTCVGVELGGKGVGVKVGVGEEVEVGRGVDDAFPVKLFCTNGWAGFDPRIGMYVEHARSAIRTKSQANKRSL